MSKVRCFNYQKHGHLACDCKERRRALRFKNNSDYRKDTFENQRKGLTKKTRNQRYRNNVTETHSEYFFCFYFFQFFFCRFIDSWLVDSGASKYFTGYKEALSNSLEIILLNQVKGYGLVLFQLDDGKSIFLQEVLNVPSLKKNLVSISAL